MPIPRPRAASAWLVALALLAAACSQPATTGQGPATTGPPGLAAGALPAGCPGAAPPPAAAPVAFAAGGRAWAASVDGRQVWCLFEVADPGPFLWGPRGDRVALAGLEVRGVGAAVARPPLEIAPLSLAWTGAAGAGLAFVAPGGLNLQVAGLGADDLRELTPLRDVSYRAVAAHPSGAALAFAVDRAGGGEIWLSNSDGGGAVRLAAGVAGDPLAFSSAGTVLYAGVREPDGSRRIDARALGNGRRPPPAWTGRRDVRTILPGPHPAGRAPAIHRRHGR